MITNLFKVDFEVRDNEIDAQGIVNNANYFVYMAHCRHKYLHQVGINFAEMAKANQNLLLIATTMEFKKPLRANEAFYVTCQLVPSDSKLRFAFEQEVRNAKDELCVKAINTGVCVDGNNRNRPYLPEQVKGLLTQ